MLLLCQICDWNLTLNKQVTVKTLLVNKLCSWLKKKITPQKNQTCKPQHALLSRQCRESSSQTTQIYPQSTGDVCLYFTVPEASCCSMPGLLLTDDFRLTLHCCFNSFPFCQYFELKVNILDTTETAFWKLSSYHFCSTGAKV